MQKICFAQNAWENAPLEYAYTRRFEPTPRFTQMPDYISNLAADDGPGGYENISLLTSKRYTYGTKVSTTLAFEGLGAPIIMFAEHMDRDENGEWRFDDYFEVVMYKNGINVWRLYPKDGKVCWHKLVGVEFPIQEGVCHNLTVQINEKTIVVEAEGHKITLWSEELPCRFHVGIDACEGINRFYDLTINEVE